MDSPLWAWEDQDLIVSFYPIDKQQEVQSKRKNGARGGRPAKPKNNHMVMSRFDSAETEGNRKGKEEERKGTEGARDEHDIGAMPAETPAHSDADRWAYVRTEPWAKSMVAAGCKIGPQNWPAWKALVASHGHDRVADVAKTCPATDRWPDRTETALLKSGGQAPIAQSIQHRIRTIKT